MKVLIDIGAFAYRVKVVAKLTDDARAMYEQFAFEFERCWACGFTPHISPRRQWMWCELHNAHILGGPNRTHDRRNLCRLCSGCHRLAHEALIRDDRGDPLPFLSYANLVYLKKHRDPFWYDRGYLRELSRLAVPMPKRPAAWFVREYEGQPGLMWLPGQDYKHVPQ